MLYASRAGGGAQQTHPVNHLLTEFRSTTASPSAFLQLMFWDDLWLHDDELARRRHATTVIERWMKVYGEVPELHN